MEYDNDRVVKGTYKLELASWVLFTIMNPLLNSLRIFPIKDLCGQCCW